MSKTYKHIGYGGKENLSADYITDGGFNNPLAWTTPGAPPPWSVSAGRAVFDGTSINAIEQTIERVAVGDFMVLTFDIIDSGGNANILFAFSGVDFTGYGWEVLGDGSHEWIFRATGTGTDFEIYGHSGNNPFKLDNVSLKKAYKFSGVDTLNVSARSGVPVDRMGNALTLTNIEVVPDGDVLASFFGGADSEIDCGSPHDLTGDVSFVWWMKPYDYGENNAGMIFDVTTVFSSLYLSGGSFLRYTCNGVNIFQAMDYEFNLWNMIALRRKADGKITFYLNGEQVGAADQAGGVPITASTNLIIGDSDASNRCFHGLIEPIIIREGLLTPAEIMQIYTNERRFYENH